MGIVLHPIAVVVEAITHLGAGQCLGETLHLVKFAALAREIPLLTYADTNELFIARVTLERLIIRTLATRDLVRLPITIVVKTVANLAARNDVRLAIPPESSNTTLQSPLAVRYPERSRRTPITFSSLTFRTRAKVVHGPIAIVVERVVAVFEFRKQLTRAIAPHAVGANLNPRNAHTDITRQRRTAITILHLRIHARAAFVNQTIAIVIDAVANLVGRRIHRRTRLRQTVHARRQHHLTRTHPAFQRWQIGYAAWVVDRLGIEPQERRTTHDRQRNGQ